MPICADLHYRFYDEGGEGFTYPIILLHGMGGSHLSWPPLLRRIYGLRVYAIDLPGHGKSPFPYCHDLEHLSECLYGWVQGMGFYHVVLAGHSLGGALALTFARRHPERTAGLMVLSCGRYFNVPYGLLSSLRSPAKMFRAVELLKKTAFHEEFPQTSRRKIMHPLLDLNPDMLLADLEMGREFRFEEMPGSYRGQTLICGGKEDAYAPPNSLRQLQHMIPGSTLYIYDNAGHMLVHEKTEEVYEAAENFFRKAAVPEYLL